MKWVKTEDRLPTIKDADIEGFVAVYSWAGCIDWQTYDRVNVVNDKCWIGKPKD